MDPLSPFSIPVKGLHHGVHQYDFQIDRSFFEQFEASPIAEGNIEMTLYFDKRPEMFVLEFEFEGKVRTECDRCTAAIDLPIADSQQLLVKFSYEAMPEEAEVIYVNPEISHFNVAQYAYEYICLALPMIKVYDCEDDAPRPCNEEMLRLISQGETSQDTEEPNGGNSIWEALKNLDQDNP